jgi:O-methyltransferase
MLSRVLGGAARARRARRFRAIHDRYRAYTMLPREAFVENLELASRYAGVPGAIVECGTWKGGMSAGLAEVLGPARDYWLFDSFEGLPPARAIEGGAALAWQAATDAPDYHDNCRAAEADAAAAMRLAGAPATIVPGWFRDTLPPARFPGGIAILRLDADWYDSTRQILDALFDRVNPGGLVIVDDYYTWEGCARAVHDFLSARERAERIRSYGGVCYLEKL